MRITDNLKKDIHDAPEWFLEAINIEPKEKYIENLKGNIAYSKWSNKGNAEDLLIFIHGTGAHKRWWDPIAPQFTEFADIIAVDLPGMGNSDFRETYSIKDFGEGIISIIEKEKSNKKIKNINIIGHSLGGQVAAYVASERTELINNLIMIDTFIRPPGYDPKDHESGPLRMIKYYPDKVSILKRFRLLPSQECLNGWFVRYIAEHSIKETEEGWRWKFDDAMFNGLERLFGYEFTFGCPTLFVYGAESLLMSGNILPNIKKTYSDIMEFEEIADAAHHVFLDKPLEIVDIIKNRLF